LAYVFTLLMSIAPEPVPPRDPILIDESHSSLPPDDHHLSSKTEITHSLINTLTLIICGGSLSVVHIAFQVVHIDTGVLCLQKLLKYSH